MIIYAASRIFNKSSTNSALTFQPKRLQFGVIMRRELMMFEQAIQLLEVARTLVLQTAMKGDHRFGFQHGLVQLQFVALWQRPQEPAQTLNVTGLLEDLQRQMMPFVLVENTATATIFPHQLPHKHRRLVPA